MLAYLLGLLAGIAQPTQTSCNGKISDRLDSPYITTYVTTATAITVLFVVLTITEGGVHIPFARIAENPAWIWCGGLCGTVIILTSIACLPKLGSAVTVMLTAFGQIMIGLIIDNFGLFQSKQIEITSIRAIGALLVCVGVVLVSMKNSAKANSAVPCEDSGKLIIYPFLAILCGIACGIQVAINGALGVAAGSSMIATLISMCVAMIGITIVTVFILVTTGKNGLFYGGKPVKFEFKWWMLSGGVLGTIIVGSNAVVAPILGAGIVTILNLVGEMAMGLFIDAIGFLGIEKKPVTLIKIIGILVMIAGTAIISMR